MTETSLLSPILPVRIRGLVWTGQGYGLVLITFLSFFPSWFHREEYLFFALLLIALATAWCDGKPIWTRTPIDLPLLLFAAWVLLTVPFATNPAYSFAEWRKLVTQVLVFYWALLVLQVREDRVITRQILAALVIGTTVLCAYALADFVSRGGTWKDRYVRAGAPSSDYNWLSTYMVMAIPMVVAAGVLFHTRWQRIVCGGAAALALLSMFVSYTRAGWLGLLAQGLAFGLLTPGRRRLALLLLLGCLLFAVGLFAASQLGYQRDTVDPWTMNARLSAWQQGFHQMVQHPIVGLGYGNNTFSPMVTGLPMGDTTMGLHSTFLMVGVGSGIPALIFLCWVFVKMVIELIHLAGRVSDLETYALLIGVAIMVVGFSVRNLFDYMFAGSLAYLFWILVAAALTCRTKNQTSWVVATN